MSAELYKAQATRLAAHLYAVHKFNLKPSRALEAIAAAHGAKDWNTLAALQTAQDEFGYVDGMADAPAAQLSPLAALLAVPEFTAPTISDALLKQSVALYGRPLLGRERRAAQHHLVRRQLELGGNVLYLDMEEYSQQLNIEGLARDFSTNGTLTTVADATSTLSPLAGLTTGDAIATVALSLLPSSESNPGADYYKQTGNLAMCVISDAMLALDDAVTFESLAETAFSQELIEALLRRLAEAPTSAFACQARQSLSAWTGSFRRGETFSDGTMSRLDWAARVKSIVGGLAGRLHMASKVFTASTANPLVSWVGLLTAGQSAYVRIPGTSTLEQPVVLASLAESLRQVAGVPRKTPLTVMISSNRVKPGTAAVLAAAKKAGVGVVVVAEHPDKDLVPEVEVALQVNEKYDMPDMILTAPKTNNRISVGLTQLMLG